MVDYLYISMVHIFEEENKIFMIIMLASFFIFAITFMINHKEVIPETQY